MSLIDFLRQPRNRRLLILGALWVFVISILFVFRQVLLVFAIAMLLAYVLHPAVRRMSSWRVGKFHLPRWACVIALYAAFFGAVYLFSLTVVPQVYREMRRITTDSAAFFNTLPQRTQTWEENIRDYVSDHGIPLDLGPADEADPGKVSLDLAQSIREGLERLTEDVKSSLPQAVGFAQSLVRQTLNFVFTLFFTLMVAAFMLIDWERIKTYLFTLLPTDYPERYEVLLSRIDSGLSGVVRGQLVICLINGTLTLVGLLVLKVKFAFVLSIVAMVLSLVPIFGSITSSVPIVLVGASQGWHTGLGALLWIVGIHALEAYFLNPKIMGAAAKIHPLVVAFALIAGEHTYGFAGALFAVPLTCIVINVFRAIHQYALELGAKETPAVVPISSAGASSGNIAAG
jgi:putative heme transporter